MTTFYLKELLTRRVMGRVFSPLFFYSHLQNYYFNLSTKYISVSSLKEKLTAPSLNILPTTTDPVDWTGGWPGSDPWVGQSTGWVLNIVWRIMLE